MYSGSLLCAITKRQFKLMLICRNVYLLKYLKRAFFLRFLDKIEFAEMNCVLAS